MRISSGLFGIVLLGVSSVALADEPVRLDSAQLDAISAGAYSTGALAFTFPSSGQGQLLKANERSKTATRSQTVIKPTSVQNTASADAAAAAQVKATGPGATASGAGGGVFTTVFLF